jgi:hypothetical protein
VWLVMKDEVVKEDDDIENAFPREGWRRVQEAIRKEFQDSGIERWPDISIRSESDVKELQTRAAT